MATMVAGGRRRFFDERTRTLVILLTPALVLIVGIYFGPIVDVVRMSLYHQSLFGNGPHFVGFDNYVAVLQNPTFWYDTVLTLIWTAGSVIFQVGLGFICAVILNERHIVNRILRPVVLLPWVLSGVVVAYLWRFLLNGNQSPVNEVFAWVHAGPFPWLSEPGWALLSVIVANIWKAIPFTTVMYLAGLTTIPADLYEAAKVDGANAWQRLRAITVPSVAPVTGVLLLLTTLWTMTFFDIVFVMTGGGPVDSTNIVPLLVYKTSFQDFDFGSGSAIALLLALFNLVFMVLYALTYTRGQPE